MEDMRPGFGPVLGPPDPRDCVEWLDGQYAREDAKDARRLTRWLIITSILGGLAILLATQARADEPYIEVNATRVQSYVKVFPGVTERLVQQEGFWGAEVFGRFPVRDRFAILGRAYSEGAAGAHSWRDPSTWQRAVGEIAVSYKVFRFALDDTDDRYTVGLMAGAGLSWQLERGSYEEMVPDAENELDGPPPKFGVGAHIRDSKLGGWVNLRAEWDAAVGDGASWCGGCILAGSVHVPVMGAKGGLGLDVAYGEHAKVNIVAKIRLFRWGGK